MPPFVGFGVRSKMQQMRANWLGGEEETAAKSHSAQPVIHSHSLDCSSWGLQSSLLVLRMPTLCCLWPPSRVLFPVAALLDGNRLKVRDTVVCQ